MQDFQTVDTWKRAHGLVLRIYQETKSLPRDETFGITMQLRQSATAIASQITGSCAKQENKEFAGDFHKVAAHCTELEYLILLAKDLALWPPALSDELMASAIEVRKMIFN
jgi:four helix bundle protein